MKKLEFTTNWNNKLDCNIFTTIRANAKYEVGSEYMVTFKGKEIGIGTILFVIRLTLAELTRPIALLDTGYELEECKKMLRTMYKGKLPSVENHVFSLYFIKKRKKDLFD